MESDFHSKAKISLFMKKNVSNQRNSILQSKKNYMPLVERKVTSRPG